jgi:uncharacterized protein
MKKKYISETYLRGVTDYDINIIEDKKYNCYISLKHIKEIDFPYISSHTGISRCLLDKDYYILEYLPINQNYAVRVFMNEKKQVLQYYIDIIKEIDIENNIPFYYDLYLDITIDILEENILKIWDEDELLEALKNNVITENDYSLAYKTLNCLLEEIKNNDNIYINRDHKKIIEKLLTYNLIE